MSEYIIQMLKIAFKFEDPLPTFKSDVRGCIVVYVSYKFIFHGAPEMLKYFRKNPITYEINGIGKPCNHNHSKATHYSSSDDSDSSDDWQDTLETHLTPPPLVTKPPRSPEQPQLPAVGGPSTQLAELQELPK